MNSDYNKEKEDFIKELKNGEYDIEFFPNNAEDYEQNINDDFSAFSEHLNSDVAKKFIAETLGK